MKVSKSLLAVIAMAGTMGFSAVASAMDFSVYGSLRGGLQQSEKDDTQIVGGATIAADDDGNITVGVVGADGLVAGGLKEGASLGDATNYGTVAAYDVDTDDFVAGGKVEAADAQLELGHGFAGSRVGIKGSEDLGNGAEAGLRWETAVGAKGDLADNGRLANVWYSGAFGKITIGQQNNPYRNAANWDQSWWIGGNNRYNDGGSRLQGIRYDGGSGAFNFSVMANADNDTDFASAARTMTITATTDSSLCATGAPTTETGSDISCVATETVTYDEVEAETGLDSIIATGHYDMGVATINLGYRTNSNESQYVGQSHDNFVISANGSLDALDWYIAFENNTDNANVTRGTAAKITPAAANGNAEVVKANKDATAIADAFETAHDVTTIGLFLGYNISDVSKVYMEWEDSANDGLDVLGENLDKNAVLLGYSRSFGPNTSFIAEYVSVDNNSELSADSTTLQGYLKVDF